MTQLKKYELLEEKFEYDKPAATQLAEAITELLTIERRAVYLRGVTKRHTKLKRFIWGTKEGEAIALHDITDSHLTNILDYLPKQGRTPSKEMLAEARSRGMVVGSQEGLADVMTTITAGTIFAPDEVDEDW